jgi:hypothetical protein
MFAIQYYSRSSNIRPGRRHSLGGPRPGEKAEFEAIVGLGSWRDMANGLWILLSRRGVNFSDYRAVDMLELRVEEGCELFV